MPPEPVDVKLQLWRTINAGGCCPFGTDQMSPRPSSDTRHARYCISSALFASGRRFAVTIAKVFFPSENETASLLAALAAFGAAYVMRPIGAIVIGAYTDGMRCRGGRDRRG